MCEASVQCDEENWQQYLGLLDFAEGLNNSEQCRDRFQIYAALFGALL